MNNLEPLRCPQSLEFRDCFSAGELAALKEGFQPTSMDDHWLVRWEEPELGFYRSWTGHCIYRVRIEHCGPLHCIGRVLVCRDHAIYQNQDDAEDRRILHSLLDSFLVERTPSYRGCLLGLAVGDALGTTLEFQAPGTFEPITDMTGGGPFRLPAGHWTDDTSMALCLADSLIENGFDPQDQMRRYLRWWRNGYRSSTGRCFDIGNTVRAALLDFASTGDPYAGSTDRYSAGNGSLMRLAPIPLYYSHEPAMTIHYAGESSRTTHGAATCIDACRYYAGLIVGALKGVDKEELLSEFWSPVADGMAPDTLTTEAAEIAGGSFKHLDPPDIRGTGYVVDALEAALWAFHRSDDFASGALLAVNLGDDADTTGAIYGQLAGAYYGVDDIPKRWLERLHEREAISRLADDLTVPK